MTQKTESRTADLALLKKFHRYALGVSHQLAERGLEALKAHPQGKEPIRELHLELTHRCNLKCIMCHHWEMPFKDPGSVRREMGAAEIRALVEGSGLLRGVEIVTITGGEPMLRQDIVEIVAFLAGHYPKASVGILSNFWNTALVRAKLTDLRERGVRNLWLGSSLDGVGDVHDKVRGQEGAFEGLMTTVRMVREEFPDVTFGFSFTVTPKNYRELWKTYRFVTDMKLPFGAQIVVNHEGFEAPETFAWKPAQLRAVERQIDQILLHVNQSGNVLESLTMGREGELQWLWSRLLYWWYLRKYAGKPERFPIMKDCMAGQRYAMIDPEGEVFFCPVNKHRKVGNLRQQPFDRIWTGPAAEKERKYVDSCRCHCWLNCIANPVLDRLIRLGSARS